MKAFIIFTLFLALSACGGGGGSSGSEPPVSGSVSVAIPAKVALKQLVVDIQKVRLKITGDDTELVNESYENLSFDPAVDTNITLNVDVPIGADRLFQIDALTDATTGQGFRGEATADVTAEGGTVAINTHFLNFAVDDEGDAVTVSLDVCPNCEIGFEVIQFIGEGQPAPVLKGLFLQNFNYDLKDFRIAKNASDPTKVDFKMTFKDIMDDTYPVAGRIVFDTNFDPQQGNAQLWNNMLGDSITADALGIENYIEFEYAPQNPNLSELYLKNSDGSLFTVEGDPATISRSQDALSLIITMPKNLANSFVGSRSSINVIVGINEFTNINPPFHATDVILGDGELEYDLDILFE